MHAVIAIILAACGWLVAVCFSTVFHPLWVVPLMLLAPFWISGGVLAVYAVEVMVRLAGRWSHSWSHRRQRPSQPTSNP